MAFGVRQNFGRYIAAGSVLHALDPLAKLAVFGAALASTLLASSAPALGLAAAWVIALCALSRVGAAFYLESLKAFAWMFALTFAINAIFPREGVAALGGEALRTAALFAARLALMILAAAVFTVVTCPSELGDAMMLGSRAGGRIGRRAAEAAALVSIALRFVPVMFEEAERIRAAQVLRGARARGLAGRVAAVVGVIVPLVESSLRRATNLGYALEARCYGYRVPAAPRVRIGAGEIGLLGSAVVVLCLTLALR
jgi:energy-coupling factor transport system permease protein